MTSSTEPLSELTHEAVSLLVREIGVARTLRFLGQYRTGHGNYTEDRHTFVQQQPLAELLDQARQLDSRSGE